MHKSFAIDTRFKKIYHRQYTDTQIVLSDIQYTTR